MSLRAVTRRQRLLGWAVVLLFFGGGGLWAWLAPLASAAVAPGVVSPEGKRKTVQHLEGGIIRAIHIREGSQVRAGDALVTLEDVRAHAEYDVLRDQHLALRATVARLEAEQADVPSLTFPEELATAAQIGDSPRADRTTAILLEDSPRRRSGSNGSSPPSRSCSPPTVRSARDDVGLRRSALPSSRRRTTAWRSRSRPRTCS